MKRNTLHTLLLIVFCTISLYGFAQTGDKAILLKNIHEIPVPDSPNYVSTTAIINNQPQIIATAYKEHGSDDQGITIITSRYKKGKILIVGSNWYFKQPLLNNADVHQFLHNAVNWGIGNSLKKEVQIWGEQAALTPVLSKQGFQVIPSTKYIIDKKTSTIILTQELADTVVLHNLDTFVSAGGTLIYGSTLADQFSKNPDGRVYTLLNLLFMKAGMFHLFEPINPAKQNNRLVLAAIPNYLHLNTYLPLFENNSYQNIKSNELSSIAHSLYMAMIFNPQNSDIIKRMDNDFGLDSAKTIIPTPEHPVNKKDGKQYLAYLLSEDKNELHPHGPNYIHPASKVFPGSVADSAARINTTVTIPVHVGGQGLSEPAPVYYRWHSTGLYVPAGESVTIMVNKKDSVQHLKTLIGVHDDDLTDHDEYARLPLNLTKTFELSKDKNKIYSPYGGILLIKIPDTCTLQQITLQVNGAVKEPYFKLGTTPLADWKTIRNYGAPWAELASDKLILTVPAYRIRQLDDPEKLLKFWNEVMDADAKLADISPERKHPERIIIDVQVAAGYMFTDVYKIVGPDDEGTADMLNEAKMRADGSWGHFHELGHRHQFWDLDFDGIGEVSVNLFTMYVFDKVIHKGIYASTNIPNKQAVIDNIKKYIASSPTFDKFKDDPFLALGMYIEIIEGFGWQPIEQIYKNFRVLPKDQYPTTQPEKLDLWFLQLSNVTHKNMAPFFDKWQIPVTANARKQVSAYPVWLPDELK